jgi:tetratricopeptide (TPR) repeat protein
MTIVLAMACTAFSLRAQQPTHSPAPEDMRDMVRKYAFSQGQDQDLTPEENEFLSSKAGQSMLEQEIEALLARTAGVTAYKAGRYDDAITELKAAHGLDPGDTTSELYLGVAYVQGIVPDDASVENVARARVAIACFEDILKKDPANSAAMKWIANIYYNIKEMASAKDWQHKIVAANPSDAGAFYTIGVIDWKQSYGDAVNLLATESLKDDGIGNLQKSTKLCHQFKQDSGFVDDGIQNLQKATELNPNYSNAMAYLNLMYRRKADIDCGDTAAVVADIAKADLWSHKAFVLKNATPPISQPKD